MNKLNSEEVKHIEKTTPFIKSGLIRRDSEIANDEDLLVNMKLTDLAFEDKVLGKGSYGEVTIATHIPT